MKKYILSAALFSFIVFSCASDSTSTTKESTHSDIKQNTIEVSGSSNSSSMAVAIEGMSCEMACVSAINKTVSALDGVSNIDMHFDTEQSVDTCFFDFDPKMINPDQVIDAIQSSNGGIYKVKAVEITRTTSAGAQMNSSSSDPDKKAEQIKYRKFNFPSLLDLIRTVTF